MNSPSFRIRLRALAALLIVTGCLSGQEEASLELVPHTTQLYTIGVPRGWYVRTFDETFPILTFVSVEPIADDFLFQHQNDWELPWFVIGMPIEPTMAVPDVTDRATREGELLEEREVLINGSSVREVIFEFERNGQQIVEWDTVVLSDCAVGTFFQLGASAPAEQWGEFWPLFQAMRDSFKTHGKWPEPPVAMATYEGETFRINYYQGWEAQGEEDRRVYFGDALPLYDNFLVVVSRPLETIPEDLSELMHRDETVVLEGPVKIAGREGYELVEKVESECPYIEWEAVVAGGSPPGLYHFYASASADAWEHAWLLIQEMRDSFEIIDGD